MRVWVKIGCLVIVAVTIVGCRPRDVLSNSEMREVLYDLHRVDGALQVAGYNYGHDEEVAGYYKQVLDKHGITQAEFDSSLVWFTDNPQIFNKIYPRVIARLNADVEIAKQERDAARLADKKMNKLGALEDVEEEVLELRDIEEVKREMRNGYENPWKTWESEEFCEKNIIIFGGMKKK